MLIWADTCDVVSSPLSTSLSPIKEDEEEEEGGRRFLGWRRLRAAGPVSSVLCSALLSGSGWLAGGRERTVGVFVASWVSGRSVRLSVCRS